MSQDYSSVIQSFSLYASTQRTGFGGQWHNYSFLIKDSEIIAIQKFT